MGRPDLWDDADARPGAERRVRQRPRRRRDLRQPRRRARRRRGAPRARPRGRRRVAGAGDRRRRSPSSARLDQLDLRSLFTGAHDEADCIVQINAKDGGVDAQDWSEMLLRMYERWAEHAGFAIRSTACRRAPKPASCRPSSPCRALCLRPDDERAGHAPARADQPVRQPGPAPDELRHRAGVAGDRRAESS